MGLGPMKNGRYQPITPYAGSWAATVNAKPLRLGEQSLICAGSKRVAVTHDAFVLCQQILQGEHLDRNVADAASEAIDGYRSGKGVDRAVASVLAAHAAKRGQQDRWGK